MQSKTSNEIRQAFLDFFAEHNHAMVASAPLPNYDNPTLLFTNAGMNQFVDVFLGKEKREYTRAVTAQKVMRVQGKHNDLENVGPSPRHHTFFEMLGNFSFGDYFKKEAIDFAWQFVTGELELEPERLWATIYLDDDESFELWQRYLPTEKILRFDEKDNFWAMGETGPCGPNSEMFYYVGDMETCDPTQLNADDDELFLEFWNLVFMQFNRDEAGTLTPLPKPSVDTGMGLERMVRILQHAESNYETDLFSTVFDRVQLLLEDELEERSQKYVGYRVIADHGRAATFLIADGVMPGNTGAGYVLRMVIRRAARYGRKIGFTDPFLAEVAKVVIDQMGEAYSELRQRKEHVLHTLTLEEERFARTLDQAIDYLDDLIEKLIDKGVSQIPGKDAFDLHATHGLALEITRDVAKERGFTVDEAGFEKAKADHARASSVWGTDGYELKGAVHGAVFELLVKNGRLDSTGVDHDPYSTDKLQAEILTIMQDGLVVEKLSAGDKAEIVTAATPFYVESGGQVSDSGTLTVGNAQFRIDEAIRPKNVTGLILHSGELVEGQLNVGDVAILQVNDRRRSDIRRNHTATHILHEELRRKLGIHVTQAGSLVAPDRLRFDFSHGTAVNKKALAQIEQAINEKILDNLPLTIKSMSKDEAVDRGAMALFGEKYGDIVRTVCIDKTCTDNPYSLELCGGLHVGETGEIGLFRFVSEGAVSAGVRRVEAVTGRSAQAMVSERLNTLERVAQKLNAPLADLETRLDALMNENRNLQKELEGLQREMAKGQFDGLMEQVQDVAGVNVLAVQVDVPNADALREMADWFRDKVGSGTAVFGTVNNDKPLLIATVTDDIIKRGVKAGDIVRDVAKMVGGGGGGRPNLAQAGGRDASKLPEALAAVPSLVEKALK